VNINIEIHGYFTTKPDMLDKMLEFSKSRYFGVNFDTGNSFISGQDPVAFLKRVIGRVNHVHIKDVSKSLADTVRGKDTGIGISHSAIGDGVNADNIRQVMAMLRDAGYKGVLGLECEGQGGPLIERSLGWVRAAMKELKIPEER
jgi:inosose dehydratase